jgi:hypothetical protein
VLLWWHNLDICSVLITTYGKSSPEALPGTTAQCVLASRPVSPPATSTSGTKAAPKGGAKKAVQPIVYFDKLTVPGGSKLRGQILDHLCRPLDAEAAAAAANADATPVPLLNEQVSMGDRESISEPLFSGVLVRLPHSCPLLHVDRLLFAVCALFRMHVSSRIVRSDAPRL